MSDEVKNVIEEVDPKQAVNVIKFNVTFGRESKNLVIADVATTDGSDVEYGELLEIACRIVLQVSNGIVKACNTSSSQLNMVEGNYKAARETLDLLKIQNDALKLQNESMLKEREILLEGIDKNEQN